MCGIAGILSAHRPVNPQALTAMTATMVHRGPDGDGIWLSPDGRVGLGHRRLSILDLTDAGAQPMLAPHGRHAITYNGEIYNYLELAAELRAAGMTFRGHCDTEVVLAAYDHWGVDFVTHLNGMFAIAILDMDRRRVVLARDRFGEKPLLLACGEGFLAFASEYKALFSLEGVQAEPEASRLARYLLRPAASLDTGPETVFPAITQLPPGHVAEIDLDTLEVSTCSYWSPRPQASFCGSMVDAAEGFRELLTDSVRLRLRSDVKVGSCLSGGLDSGSIVGIARNLLGPDAPYHVFSGRFPGTQADEGEFLDATATAAGVVRHDVEPSARGLLDELPDFLWKNELPMDSGSQYAQYCVFRAARENGVIVLLDGQGADEVLGGYEQFFAIYLAGLRRSDPAAAAREEKAIRHRYPGALAESDQGWKTRIPLPLKRLLGRLSGRGSDLRLGLRPEITPLADPRPHAVDLSAALREEAFGGFLATLLRYGDRNSMAHSLEVRLPFCDHRIAEFALSLPPRYLMGDTQTKRLLREAMRGILPETVRTRWRKQGFLPPQALWFAQGLEEALAEIIADGEFAHNPWWDRGWCSRALSRLKAGDHSLAGPLWKVLISESWRRHVLARHAAAPRFPAVVG